MNSYITPFAVPTIGRKHETGNGLEILVSARFLTDGHPYDVVTHIDPWEKAKSIKENETGMLLIEARDSAALDAGTIGHCVLSLDSGNIDILEMEVAYAYRGNYIMEALIALSWKLTDIPVTDLSEDAFKYL